MTHTKLLAAALLGAALALLAACGGGDPEEDLCGATIGRPLQPGEHCPVMTWPRVDCSAGACQ